MEHSSPAALGVDVGASMEKVMDELRVALILSVAIVARPAVDGLAAGYHERRNSAIVGFVDVGAGAEENVDDLNLPGMTGEVVAGRQQRRVARSAGLVPAVCQNRAN